MQKRKRPIYYNSSFMGNLVLTTISFFALRVKGQVNSEIQDLPGRERALIPNPITSYPNVARSVALCGLQGAGLLVSLGRALVYFVIGFGIICRSPAMETPGYLLRNLGESLLAMDSIEYKAPADYEDGEVRISWEHLKKIKTFQYNLMKSQTSYETLMLSIPNSRLSIDKLEFRPIPILGGSTIEPMLEREFKLTPRAASQLPFSQLALDAYVQMNIHPLSLTTDPTQQINRAGLRFLLKY